MHHSKPGASCMQYAYNSFSPKKKGKCRKRPPPENRKKIAEKKENGPQTLFSSHFSAIFSYSLGEAVSYIFLGFGPEARNLFCRKSVVPLGRPVGRAEGGMSRGP